MNTANLHLLLWIMNGRFLYVKTKPQSGPTVTIIQAAKSELQPQTLFFFVVISRVGKKAFMGA